MPGVHRRRESQDMRGDRFESQVRMSDMEKPTPTKQIITCSRCHHVFQEKSRTCPYCETRTMGTLTMIPDKHLEEAKRRELRDLQRKYR